MWWGYSPALDLQAEISTKEDAKNPLDILILGACDARHIVKTIASSYKHSERTIKLHVIEGTVEQVARSILLLSISLEEKVGLQEATRYYLELLGNTLLRPATAKYLAKCCNRLADIPTKTIDCPWIDLDKLKHRDRDRLESIFKFWSRATCEGVPITEYWDRKIRKVLNTRYDYREGVFDWDYHMVLKYKGTSALTLQEYKFWRNNGIAFTWLEGEPARSNATLLNNIIQHGSGFLHYAYLGDITTGPFFTWALDPEAQNNDKKLRATDVAEREVMRSIYEIRTKEPLCEDFVAAHRDPSILNGIIMTEMPDREVEQESWTIGNKLKDRKEEISWTSVPRFKVLFHPVETLKSMKNKQDYVNKYDLIWVAHNMTKQIEHCVPLLKIDAPILVESRKFIVELRKNDLDNFTKDIKDIAQEHGLLQTMDFNSAEHMVAKLRKK